MLGWLKSLVPGPGSDDGFGQSLADDIRYRWRFHRCRRRSMMWAAPSARECAAIDAHPIIGRFGDLTIGVADIDGQRWIVRDRDWYGWPDPPEYVFFALDGDRIWSAADFSDWPRGWVRTQS